MDYNLKGHPYVKSAIDMACWDILGKATGLSVNTLLGGNFNPDGIPLYRAIGQASPAKMAEQVEFYVGQGYQRFQLKLGGDPAEDIERIRACRETLSLPGQVLIGDSNTGWTTAGALRVAAAVKELDVYMEQPCPSYRECLTVRWEILGDISRDSNIRGESQSLPRYPEYLLILTLAMIYCHIDPF